MPKSGNYKDVRHASRAQEAVDSYGLQGIARDGCLDHASSGHHLQLSFGVSILSICLNMPAGHVTTWRHPRAKCFRAGPIQYGVLCVALGQGFHVLVVMQYLPPSSYLVLFGLRPLSSSISTADPENLPLQMASCATFLMGRFPE